jgi:RND family efflux transporter MFP subunit
MYTKWKLFTDLATNDTYETSQGAPKNDERLSSEFQAMQDTWAAAEKKYKDQQTAIAAAQAQVASTRLAYQSTQDATVTAPTDGIVANLSVAPGDSITALSGILPVSASSQGITSIRPALSLTKDERMEMIVQLGQTDISKVEEGQTVIVYPDAQKTKEYKGTIARVDSIGSNIGGVVKYNVYVELAGENNNLKSGMTGDVDIETTRIENVVTVPNAAVRPYKGGKAVRVIKKGQKEPEFIPVEIGLRGKERTQIIQGIDEGQEIIVSVKNEAKKNSGFLF